MSLFSAVAMAPRDPILGLNEQYAADPNPQKVNLGVGVYFDDNGKIPLLGAVRSAEKTRLEAAPPRGYQPIDGIVAYNKAVQGMLFGADSRLVAEGKVVTVQTLGGTGALKDSRMGRIGRQAALAFSRSQLKSAEKGSRT